MSPCRGFIPVLVVERIVPEPEARRRCRGQIVELRWLLDDEHRQTLTGPEGANDFQAPLLPHRHFEVEGRRCLPVVDRQGDPPTLRLEKRVRPKRDFAKIIGE